MDDLRSVARSSDAVERVLLGSAYISVPKPAQTKTFQTPDGVPYEQFGLPVSGGFLNFHIFDYAKCVRRGNKLWVEAKVWRKTMSDGRQFLYVDLHPTEERLTHERKLYQRPEDVPNDLPVGTIRFDTLAPINGVLVFIPRSPAV